MHNIDKHIRVAIAQGDLNGVGYEFILRTFADSEVMEMFTPIIYGSGKVASIHADALQLNCRFHVINDAREVQDGHLNILSAIDDNVKVEIGKPTLESSSSAVKAVERAVRDYSEGLFDVLVLNPVDKSVIPEVWDVIRTASKHFGSDVMPLKLLTGNNINIASVAGDVTASEVAKYISKDDIIERTKLLRDTLRRDFRIDIPCIAILSQESNAVVAQQGMTENVVEAAIETLAAEGVQAFGPYETMEFFDKCMWQNFDAVLAMHDDQYMDFYKHLFDFNGALLHAGLPIVVTSTLWDPMYAEAGKKLMDETSFRNAIYTAIDVYRNRFYYDQPLANPLPKMYHERKEDGERVRFTVRKKDGDFEKSDSKA